MSSQGQQLAAHQPSANGAEIGNAMTKNQTIPPKAGDNNNNNNSNNNNNNNNYNNNNNNNK